MGYPADTVESQDELTLDQLLAFPGPLPDRVSGQRREFNGQCPRGPGRRGCDGHGPAVAARPQGHHDHGRRPTPGPVRAAHTEEFAASAVTSIGDSTDEDCAAGACPVR